MFSFLFSLLFSVTFSLTPTHILQNGDYSKAKALTSNLTDATNPCGFTQWYQCDSRWGSDYLGFSTVNTICSAGCAMSSVAMMLTYYGTFKDPGTLNQWLKSNSGYVETDLIVWGSVDPLGTDFIAIESDLSIDTISNGLSQCHGIIANVLSGTHWVLLTAYAGNGNFYVNDPAGFYDTYNIDGMIQYAVYHNQTR